MSDRLNGNCFIVDLPEQSENQTITVVKMSEFKSNKVNKTLYKKSFEKFFLNLEGRLPEVMHKLCLATVLPTLALLIHYEKREEANILRETFLQQAPTESLQECEEYPDQESSLHYILAYNLKQFIHEAQTVGVKEAVKNHNLFFTLIQKVYFELPVIYVETIIDMTNP